MEGTARRIHGQVLVIGADPVQLGVVVGEQTALQHLVRRVAHAGHGVGRRKGRLLHFRVVIVRIAVQLENANGQQREIRVRPHFRQVERVPARALLPLCQLLVRRHLQLDFPLGEIAAFDGAEQVALGVVGVGTGQAARFRGRQIPDALARLEVPFHVHALAIRIDQAIRVAAEAIHVTVAVRRAAVREEHGDLVQAFRRMAPEIEHHFSRFQIALRIALLRVDEVGELDRVLDEEHGRVVAHQIPVALFRIKAHGETARIAFRVGTAAFPANGGETREGRRLLAHFTEQFGLGVARDIVRDGKSAVGARTFGMHHALGNALAVEMLEFFDQVEVLQQQGTAGAGADGILVVGDGNTRGGAEWRLLAHGCFSFVVD
ncbi:hypothetical protein JaAD80_19100 [Janthinobacterium sp. AD80]|nr:hypothetical protein JaAD80_19100 [Janthinobacterium sp. AD80]